MDIKNVRSLLDELAAFMKENNLAELELDVDGAEVKLRKTATPPAAAPVPAAVPAVSDPAAAPSAQPHEPPPGTAAVSSPMVGTFYRASKPDSDPFCEVGDEVDEDSVLCIIEAMKVMNEIKAEQKGRIAEILVENGEPVEYGQPLFRITPLD
jgi:acetyl-CoA carboxylase biotin carboxyl carrier protein